MLLTYSDTRFPDLITSGIKIHTIRKDSGDRWKPGMKIHHWMYNPRHVSKNPFPFKAPGAEILISKQKIHIIPEKRKVFIDNMEFKNLDLLAYNDGLINANVFYERFNVEFKGYILHWTGLRY